MALVSQAIANLLGGVSQRPQAQRDASECEEQINLIADIGTGLRTRPPSVRSSTLSATPTSAYDSVHEHDVLRSADDRYRIIISDGDLKVFDVETGTEQTVDFPNGKAYLDAADPANDFRCVTVGKVTYIVNRNIVTAKGDEVSQAARNEALVSIRQADFGTTYSITLDDSTVSFTTVEGFSPSDRTEIATETIAETLEDLITSDGDFSDFRVARYGSTLYIRRIDGEDFTISASDGLADEGIRAIKGSVQRFDDLPERAKNGFVVEVAGDPTNEFDNYFVRYDDNGLPNLAGVWKETVKPGILVSLDNTTMPHKLAREADIVANMVAETLPSSPVVAFGDDVTTVEGFNLQEDIGLGTSGALSPSIAFNIGEASGSTDGRAVSGPVSDFDGTRATVRATYDVSTLSMRGGVVMWVQMWLSNTPSTTYLAPTDYTKVAEKLYQSGRTYTNEFLEYVAASPASNTRVQLRVVYALNTGSTESAVVTVHSNTDSETAPAGLKLTKTIGKIVTFNPDAEYPAGTVVTLTVGATDYDYTAVSGDTGETVATTLAALIGGGYSGTSPDPGIIEITGTPIPDVSVSISFDSATTFFSTELSLTVDELVGALITNLSDGSSGTITSNTENTITVAALTGGGTNTFRRGDVCTVTGVGSDFVFAPALWKSRAAGDAITAPLPSFIGQKIDEIFFDRARLGMLSRGNVVLSQAGEPLNLFRQSATKLLADDPIDVQAASAKVANFHAAVSFDEKMLLWSRNSQSILDGKPNLSPETVSITGKTDFVNSTRLRPVVAGNRLYFAHAHGDCTRVFEYSTVNETGAMDAEDITAHIPTYITGSPIAMVADSSLGFLAVLTDDDQGTLYVCNYHYASQTRVQNAWSKWQFNGATIVAMGMVDSVLSLVVKRSTGVYVETIDLDPANAGAVGNDANSAPFNWSYTFSRIYKRSVNRDGRTEVDARGRLTIRRMMLQTHDTDGMTATVSLDGRTAIDYAFTGSTDEFRFPVLGRNSYATIALSGTSADAVFIDGLEWEGNFDARSARV